MPAEIESGTPTRKKLPRYRLVASPSEAFTLLTPLVLLTAFTLFVGIKSFGAFTRILTCAPTQKVPATDLDDSYYGYGYNFDDASSIKHCIPASLHASWVPASLAAVSMAALAVMALILFIYLLRLCYDYVDQARQDQTRGFHTLPDQFKYALNGLTVASGVFMLAAVSVYCVIYMVALS